MCLGNYSTILITHPLENKYIYKLLEKKTNQTNDFHK